MSCGCPAPAAVLCMDRRATPRDVPWKPHRDNNVAAASHTNKMCVWHTYVQHMTQGDSHSCTVCAACVAAQPMHLNNPARCACVQLPQDASATYSAGCSCALGREALKKKLTNHKPTIHNKHDQRKIDRGVLLARPKKSRPACGITQQKSAKQVQQCVQHNVMLFGTQCSHLSVCELMCTWHVQQGRVMWGVQLLWEMRQTTAGAVACTR